MVPPASRCSAARMLRRSTPRPLQLLCVPRTIKENANDILTDAKEINEQRAADAAAEVIEDAACACTEETASAEESTEA